MAASLPLQAIRLHLPHAPGPVCNFDFDPVFVVIFSLFGIFLSGGTACLNTTLALKVHCAFPESSIIKCSIRLCPQNVAGNQAGSHPFKINPVIAVIFLDWQNNLCEGTVCLNTTLVLKVHCTFPETSKIKCSTSLRLHPITRKQARARLPTIQYLNI